MSKPTWDRSHWALVLVVIILLVLVAVKHTAARQRSNASAAQPTAIASASTAPERKPQPLPGARFGDTLKNGLPTVADFGAGWCQQCKRMVPVLDEAAARYRGKVNVVFVNTDEYPSIAKDYRISAIPTQVFFDGRGAEVGRHVGYYPIEDMDTQMRSLGLLK